MEIIKSIIGFEGYFISNKGKVYCNLGKGNRRTGKTVPMYEINPRPNKKGYLRVCMRENATNKRKDIYVHRLVAQYFLSRIDNSKNVVNHKDCNVQNNNHENLEWVTCKENIMYAMQLGRLKRNDKGVFITGL